MFLGLPYITLKGKTKNSAVKDCRVNGDTACRRPPILGGFLPMPDVLRFLFVACVSRCSPQHYNEE